MADETNNLGDDIKDGANELANNAKEAAGDAKEAAGDFADNVKEKAGEFADDAKEAANDIKESWNEATNSGENKKILAGILAIVLGWLGVHKFILGYTKEGIIMAACGVVGMFLCGIPTMIVSVIGLVEGIMYLMKSDEEFMETYQVGRKPWF